MRAPGKSSTIWLLAATAGYIVWSLAFVALYAYQGFACASEADRASLFGLNFATAILLTIWIVHLAAGGALFAFGRRSRGAARRKAAGGDAWPFLADLTCLLAIAGIVSTIYIGAPILFLAPCT